jgi:hypothetical protein
MVPVVPVIARQISQALPKRKPPAPSHSRCTVAVALSGALFNAKLAWSNQLRMA